MYAISINTIPSKVAEANVATLVSYGLCSYTRGSFFNDLIFAYSCLYSLQSTRYKRRIAKTKSTNTSPSYSLPLHLLFIYSSNPSPESSPHFSSFLLFLLFSSSSPQVTKLSTKEEEKKSPTKSTSPDPASCEKSLHLTFTRDTENSPPGVIPSHRITRDSSSIATTDSCASSAPPASV